MSPGKINGPLDLVITHLKDFDSLLDFTCGIPEMDAFIHSRFKDSVINHFGLLDKWGDGLPSKSRY